jgi:hypothetical protein
VKFLEVLCEGSSDVPVLREVLTRRFGLEEDVHFRIHPHQGKGNLPASDRLLVRPDAWRNQLLDLLPIKLKNYGLLASQNYEVMVLVVVDADDDPCDQLKSRLVHMYDTLPSRPRHCVFRIAVEETESWLIADTAAVRSAYTCADISTLVHIDPDSICGAWEKLATALGLDPSRDRERKVEWAATIAPHLNLQAPPSPSLRQLIGGAQRLVEEQRASLENPPPDGESPKAN